jgi:hypothetical protein
MPLDFPPSAVEHCWRNSPQEVERMFNRLAGLLSRIRKKPLTEEERLSKEEARLEALRERDYKEYDWHKFQG